MKPTAKETSEQQPIALQYDELYRQPLRAARGLVVAFWLTLLVWILLFAAWWAVSHHRPSTKAPTSHSRQ